jgi:threonine/homoserine/homoserine lactone efflux protein
MMVELGLWLLTGAAMVTGAMLARAVDKRQRRVRRVADWIAALASVALAVWVATR